MARSKDYTQKKKRLQNQARSLREQPLTRTSREFPNLTVVTARGKVEQKLLTLQNTD